MRSWRWIALTTAIAAIALIAQFVLPRSHVLFPPRASNGVEYNLYVHVPPACRSGGCPALYILDGDLWLPTFTRMLGERLAAHRIEPVVLVGIGYRDVLSSASRRKHDFTPAFGRARNRTGWADSYLDALQNDLIPYAEAHLPISRVSRGIAGHSYGGLFATYTLQRAPTLFDRYLIMSPALWFDDGKIYDQPFAASAETRQVFLAADTPRGVQGDMARDVVRLNELLTQQPHLAVSRAMIVDETHNSMVAPAVRRGLDALYGSTSPG